MTDFTEQNRLSWNELARIHVRDETGFYEVDAFRRGGDALTRIENDEIGDVTGLNILHLQCHFGLDTLSLARRGAAVTGLDFSSDAIDAARVLSEETGVAARFVEGNVFDAPALVEGQFDLVYVTWGAICWLSDIAAWCDVVGHFVKRGGVVYLADTHPMASVLEEVDGRLVVEYDWRTRADAPLHFDEVTTYTGDPTVREHQRSNEWNHPLSTIFQGLMRNGFAIEMFNEHEALPWEHVPMMELGEDGFYRLPEGIAKIPLAFSLKARKT